MKIIEALKKIKLNEKKIADYTTRIKQHSAILSTETSPYADTKKEVDGWLQAVADLVKENETLMRRVHTTNTSTQVNVEVGGKQVTKSIDEWLYRRNKGIEFERLSVAALTDRNLKEQAVPDKEGKMQIITINRHYDASLRDKRLGQLMDEPSQIDMALEIVNATTDLLEV